MLVGYSSSSDEEVENPSELADSTGKRKTVSSSVSFEEDCHDRAENKKMRIEQQGSKTRLPVPGCLLAMFPEEEEPDNDTSLHDGRIRSFKHERGNWATYVYFPYPPDEDFMELLEELLEVAGARGVLLTQQREFHLSVSQTVVLKHHWIQPFTESLKGGLTSCKRFVCSAGSLRVYSNAERTRTFLGMEVSAGHAQLAEIMKMVDKTMIEFRLDTFYKDPSFHVSLAWCVGDFTAQLKECLKELQGLVDHHEEGAFLLTLDCQELRCRAGNKTFSFPLQS
ncbi:U6 snRNA phosphodiesterase 1 isoform X1 [Gadus chalcogrammus]|uniref:U6 snRNA phosphodiesterase 1 isoform X1 n=2 Tax=Gadus chalcogrammus TaxID=1042646 RepID=UPI0024C4A83B|nr:U6 snRNA phosphodiesterase 1 isoform X1 [Gadus chalcogrammus]